ncbi:hypothetical protein WA026_016868 [Henosepilachna vigintioctopunctata]|uniref:ABC-type xenobiotic transporter n=1 Tax=Henosepilachna vigintioctopunctata TaxID=420089 RepID=A0AAW1U008_9CUCU
MAPEVLKKSSLQEQANNNSIEEAESLLEKKQTEVQINISSPKKIKEAPPIGYLQMFRYTTPIDKLLILIGLAATIIMSAVQPLNNLLFGDLTQTIVEYVINSATTNETIKDEASKKLLDGIADYSIKMFGIGIFTILLGYVSMETFIYTSMRQIFRIRSIYSKKVLNQDISWYDQHQTGDFATKMSDDLSKLEEGMVLAFVKGWELALVCLASLPVSLLCVGVVSVLSTKLARKESDAYGAAGSIAEEVLGAIRTVHAFGGENLEMKRYDQNLIISKKNNIFRNTLSGIGFSLLWFAIYASYALSFWYGVGLIIGERGMPNPTYTPGNMITVFFSVMNGCMNFGIASTFIEIFSKAKASGGKIFALIDTVPIINISKNRGLKPDTLKGHIQFKNVKFHYPSRQDVPVLTGLSLEIKPGQTVALVGSSGCGKSSCIQLLQRFYDPTSGEIFVDGNNLKDLNLTWYRENIGVVCQEPMLFGTTIEENINYGNVNANGKDIIWAAKIANAYDFTDNLPHGMRTVVGEKGAQLSVGQKQRVAIARALLKDPDLLLLDEATSALDNESESEVLRGLESVNHMRTTIIVAHRLSTIRNADKIFVISKGTVVEEGTHDELMALNGEYFNLVTSQIANKEFKEQESQEDDKKIDNFNELAVSGENTHDNKFSENMDDEKDDEIKSISFWQIIKMNSPEWIQITIASIASIISGFSFPIFALLIGDIIWVLSGTDDDVMRTETNKYCLYFVIAGIVVGLSTMINIYFFTYAGESLTLRLRSQLFKAMLRQEEGWYDRKENGVGALCAKLSGEAALVQGATGQRLGIILNSMATLVLSIALAIYYSWKLGLVTMLFMPFMLMAIFLQHRFTNNDEAANLKSVKKSMKIAIEAINNVRTVASLVAEDIFHMKFLEDLMKQQKKLLRNSHLRSTVYGMSTGIHYIAFATAIFYGGYLIVDGMPFENVFKVSQALILGTFSIAHALAFSPNLQKGINAASSALKLLNRVPKIADSPYATKDELKKSSVEYFDVDFSYPTRPSVLVLKEFNLNVFKSKTVALVGASGCGKSTVVQLLERFYDPNSGSVSLDGKNIKDISVSGLRSHLGIVSQEPNLFDRTIGENIAYGDNSRVVSQEEIIEAAKKANIHNFISSLPLGYSTRLGEKGTQLSGGQKQRVAIARALIRNPMILLLDEATSALDTESEKVVQEALDKAKEGRTCVIIAHRLTTIQDADIICVINKGKLAELGNHQELMKKKGLYYQLYSLQGQ